MKVYSFRGEFDGCVDAVATPRVGARVEYRRGDDKYFHITIDPPKPGGAAIDLRANGADVRYVVLSSDNCAGEIPTLLPIWGPSQLGDWFRPPGEDGSVVPGTLVDGTVSVYARAHEHLIGMSFPPLIYRVNSFDLPPGYVLLASSEAADPEHAAWTGAARIEASRPGFTIQASSGTRHISLSSAGSAITKLII